MDIVIACFSVLANLCRFRTELERTDGYLNEVLHQFNLEPSALGRVQKTMDDVIQTKNSAIRELENAIRQNVQSHNKTVNEYERKLAEYGIPIEELGFKPQILHMPNIKVHRSNQ